MQHIKTQLFIAALLLSAGAKAQVTSFTIDPAKFNQPLKARLDSLYQADQAPRLKLIEARQRKESPARLDSLQNLLIKQDQENVSICTTILDKYGWLGPQKVGVIGSQALFMVIQHAGLPIQKKYLPMIREAERKGEILSSNLAILEDRVNMREGRKQLYGSQGFTDKQTGKRYIYPIADVVHLDERRKRMGLNPMAEYAKVAGMPWNPEEYQKALPEIEQIAARQKM